VFKVKLYKHAGTGALKGDALVTYMSAEESDKAASLLHRQSIRSGYVISVKKADFTQSESKKRVRFDSSSYYVRIICQRLLAAAG
jgi:hypothetical protein